MTNTIASQVEALEERLGPVRLLLSGSAPLDPAVVLPLEVEGNAQQALVAPGPVAV